MYFFGILLLLNAASAFCKNIDVNVVDTQDRTNSVEQNSKKTKQETTVELIPFDTEYEDDYSKYEGETSIKRIGLDGERTQYFEVVYVDGVEISRTKIKTEITKQPITQIILVGKKHKYTGYCQVEGTYRNRYPKCYGDYSPDAYNNALKKANECNVNTKPIKGCYNRYQ